MGDALGAITSVVQENLELWRQVPFAVVVGYYCPPPGRARLHCDLSSVFLTLGDDHVEFATSGIWPLEVNPSFDDRRVAGVDCATGRLVWYTPGECVADCEVLSDMDTITHVLAKAAPLLDPTPLVAKLPSWLRVADAGLVTDMMANNRLTPRWHAPFEPLDGPNATVLSLAGSWHGDLSSLLDSADLLLCHRPAHRAA